MSEWISVKERLPTKSGVYPACSALPQRRPPDDWVDSLCMYNAEAKKGECRWQHSSGFYDNGITHWMLLPPPPSTPC